MKKTLLLITCLFTSSIVAVIAQTPTYYVHNPSNMGVNNSYMHPSVMKKFLFIYNKAELNAAGISGATTFNRIWFRMNNSGTVTLNNCVITIGHTTFTSTTPNTTFASNFNVGAPVVVLSASPLNYTFAAGAWNVPADTWSPITLGTSFTYNDVDNLAIMIEFSSQSGSIPSLYADNGGAPITRYTNTVGGATATSTTARPAFGISNTTPLFNVPELQYGIQQDKVVFSTILTNPAFVKQELAYSTNNGENWRTNLLPSVRETWTIDIPVQKTLYRMYFTDKDGQKHATNVIEIETNLYQKSISVYPTVNNGTFTISYPELHYGSVVITDFKGKILYNIPQNTNQNQEIQISLPAGLYFVQDVKKGKSIKIVVQ